MKIRNDIVGAGFHARPREAERLPYRDYAIGEERFFVASPCTGEARKIVGNGVLDIPYYLIRDEVTPYICAAVCNHRRCM